MINLKKADPVDLNKSVVQPMLANMKMLDVKANVVLVLDDSGSMVEEYEEDHVQLLADRALALAMSWDTDQKIDIYTLNQGYMGTVEVAYFRGWVKRNIKQLGSTPFARATKQILDRFGAPAVQLPVQQTAAVQRAPQAAPKQTWWQRLFGIKPQVFPAPYVPMPVHTPDPGPVARVTAPVIPTYVLFVTDGANDDPHAMTPLLMASSHNAIFFQFMGLGDARMPYLEQIDNLPGRPLDNTSFFRMPCPDEQVVDDGWLYQQLAKDFGRWLKDARTAGIVA